MSDVSSAAPTPIAGPKSADLAAGASSSPAVAALIQGLPLRPWRPVWLPDTQGFLALAIIILIAVIVCVFLLRPVALDERAAGVLMTVIGVLIACLKDVYNFYFGSSSSSRQKDETIATQSAALAVSSPPAPPAA